MPELPEVEAVCARLRAEFPGLAVTGATVFRCAPKDLPRLVRNRTIGAVDRMGKHILLRLSGGWTLHTHLRMSGNLFSIPDHRFHGDKARVVLQLEGGGGIVLEDPRALARMDPVRTAAVDAKLAGQLGPEPLSSAFTADWFAALARQSRQPSKIFLMDQSRVSGLGNIYAAEALFRAGIHPRKRMASLARPRLRRLHAVIEEVFRDAVQSAKAAYAGPGEFGEAETFPLSVYDRENEPCRTCGSTIRRIAQGGRSTYYCPGCQR
jgi:formamidopyrimidine-DNA glycosylase